MARLTRGRRLLQAQRRLGPPLGPPPDWLSAEEMRAWRDVVAAAPDVLRRSDEIALELIASQLARWRSGCGDPKYIDVRELYRQLGMCFVPMHERRRLIFPDRQRKQR